MCVEVCAGVVGDMDHGSVGGDVAGVWMIDSLPTREFRARIGGGGSGDEVVDGGGGGV